MWPLLTLNCRGRIVGHYRGPRKDGRDLEAIGVVKLSSHDRLIQ